MRQERDMHTETYERDLYSFGYNYDLKNRRVNIYSPYDKVVYAIGKHREWVRGFRIKLDWYEDDD